MQHDICMTHPDSGFAELPLPLFLPVKGQETIPSYLRDHRKRLRDRFMAGGPDAVPDYELLELILFRAIPRQDVKPLARTLIDTFGDLTGR
jgi:DNA repair protein RadC